MSSSKFTSDTLGPPRSAPRGTYLLCVAHTNAFGRSTLCSLPIDVTLAEFQVIKTDIFRWMDGPGIGSRLTHLRPNQVVVTDEDACVLFSASRNRS